MAQIHPDFINNSQMAIYSALFAKLIYKLGAMSTDREFQGIIWESDPSLLPDEFDRH